MSHTCDIRAGEGMSMSNRGWGRDVHVMQGLGKECPCQAGAGEGMSVSCRGWGTSVHVMWGLGKECPCHGQIGVGEGVSMSHICDVRAG